MWERFPGPKQWRCSLIVAVLESYEIVRKQCLWWAQCLPDDWEVILLDDGSQPPLDVPNVVPRHFSLVLTRDTRPWTQPLARNLGARLARADLLFLTDIDHMLSREAIAAVSDFRGDRMLFPREFAVLDDTGQVIREPTILQANGWTPEQNEALVGQGLIHANTFAIRRDLFLDHMAGYETVRANQGLYGGDDIEFHQRYQRLVSERSLQPDLLGPSIFVYPDPAANRDFHGLSRTPPFAPGT